MQAHRFEKYAKSAIIRRVGAPTPNATAKNAVANAKMCAVSIEKAYIL